MVLVKEWNSRSEVWKTSDDGKTLTIISEGSDDEMENLELTDDKLVLSERNDKIIFKHI